MLTPESRIKIAPDVMFREVGGEAVILNSRSGTYFGLDEVGARMWTLLDEHARLGTVHTLLLDEYDVTADRLWQDLVRLVAEMQAAGLVTADAPEDA